MSPGFAFFVGAVFGVAFMIVAIFLLAWWVGKSVDGKDC